MIKLFLEYCSLKKKNNNIGVFLKTFEEAVQKISDISFKIKFNIDFFVNLLKLTEIVPWAVCTLCIYSRTIEGGIYKVRTPGGPKHCRLL